MSATDDAIFEYARQHSSPEDKVLAELNRETHLRTVYPNMLSGHLQGRFLEMISRLLAPQRILEIGTFTGYSAICMARGLGEGGLLHTIDINDETMVIARKYITPGFTRRQNHSAYGKCAGCHFKSHRDIRPCVYRCG